MVTFNIIFFIFLEIVCCLHCKDVEETNKVIPFTHKSLNTCTKYLRARKQQNLKYANVSLPETAESEDVIQYGYHKECYKVFTALSNAQKRLMLTSEFVNNFTKDIHKNTQDVATNSKATLIVDKEQRPRMLRSKQYHLLPKKTSGVFQNVCLFCKKHENRLKSGKRDDYLSATHPQH